MTTREQAEQLRQQAIQTLIDEKEAIDKMLKTLGYGESPTGKRRGRRPKLQEAPLPVEQHDVLPMCQNQA